MWDWSLGQAGFGEQIQVYGEMFWRQVATTVLCASAVFVVLLLLAALMVTLARRTETSRGMRLLRRVDKFPDQPPVRSDRIRGDRTERTRSRAA